MTMDVPRMIGAVTRQLTAQEKDGAPARALVASRTYHSDRRELWDAFTNPERIPRWFLPVTGDFRTGGHFQLQGHAGGDIVVCDAPTRLELTWGMFGSVSWVTVDLSEDHAGQCVLRLEHVAHVPDEAWEQFGPGAVGIGWDSILMGLEQHLASGAPVTPEAVAVWTASEEGKSFMHLSSEAWSEASIANGADPSSARAAAARATAMYLGA